MKSPLATKLTIVRRFFLLLIIFQRLCYFSTNKQKEIGVKMANPKKLITWENYQKDLSKSFGSLFRSREFTDVTISCENRKIEAHKFLLAASSPFFEEVFVENPCDHPVMVLKNVNYDDVFDVICYIYQGHISIDESREESFLQTAELLAVPVNNVAGCSKVTGKTLNKDSVSVRQFKQHKESHEQNTDDDDESDTSTDAQNHDDDDDDDSYLDGLFEDDNNEEYDERPRNLKQLPTIKLKNIASKEIVIDKNERLKTKKKLINAQLHIDKVNKKVNAGGRFNIYVYISYISFNCFFFY